MSTNIEWKRRVIDHGGVCGYHQCKNRVMLAGGKPRAYGIMNQNNSKLCCAACLAVVAIVKGV